MQRSQGTTDMKTWEEIITTCAAGELRLGYPETITLEEIPF